MSNEVAGWRQLDEFPEYEINRLERVRRIIDQKPMPRTGGGRYYTLFDKVGKIKSPSAKSLYESAFKTKDEK